MKQQKQLSKRKQCVINQIKVYLIGFLFAISPSSLLAQHLKLKQSGTQADLQNAAKVSELRNTACSHLAITKPGNNPLLLNIRNLEGRYPFNDELKLLKSSKTKNKLNSINYQRINDTAAANQFSPIKLSVPTDFKGNIFNGGAPPDNTIAVSANGTIVSVINCNVAYYNQKGAALWTGSFWELFNDPTLTELIYDPIVKYDSQADRFVMIAIHGFTAAASKLIIAFSKTNNPLDGWWVYKLSGNPLNNQCWLDYPKLGISNDEIFVTGNLFAETSGFSESVVYQIGKGKGYTGGNLKWQLWSDIVGAPITIIPASYGQQGNYGPGLYFVNQSPASGNAVQLYEITDTLGGQPVLTRKTIFKSDYEPGGNAMQLGTNVELITGDCRILNAFYLNGLIHYVFQSDYQNSNYTGINYNRLNVSTLTHSSYTFGEEGYDCAYPVVASWSVSQQGTAAVFCYLRSGADIYPETRVVVFDSNQMWSESILVKGGVNYVDAFQFENTVRWGDYAGIAYRYNAANPEVWVSGCYGSRQKLFSTDYNCFNNWIAQISDLPQSGILKSRGSNPDFGLFPNPAVDFFNVEFQMAISGLVKIEITDLTGKVMTGLFSGTLPAGKNSLTFNRKAIPSGSYLLSVTTADNAIVMKKFIVEN